MKARSGFNSPKCSSLKFEHFNVHRIVIWGSLPEWADGTTVANSLTLNSFSRLNASFWGVFKCNRESVASCTCCHVAIRIEKHSWDVCRHCCALTIKLGVLFRWNINVSIYLARWIGRLKSVSDVATYISGIRLELKKKWIVHLGAKCLSQCSGLFCSGTSQPQTNSTTSTSSTLICRQQMSSITI